MAANDGEGVPPEASSPEKCCTTNVPAVAIKAAAVVPATTRPGRGRVRPGNRPFSWLMSATRSGPTRRPGPRCELRAQARRRTREVWRSYGRCAPRGTSSEPRSSALRTEFLAARPPQAGAARGTVLLLRSLAAATGRDWPTAIKRYADSATATSSGSRRARTEQRQDARRLTVRRAGAGRCDARHELRLRRSQRPGWRGRRALPGERGVHAGGLHSEQGRITPSRSALQRIPRHARTAYPTG